MIIHWRAHLNSVQNAVGYMIKPTMPQFFSGPGGEALVLSVSDLMVIADLDSKAVNKAVVSTLNLSDNITELVIPSWLRKLRVEEVEHYITIKRIR